MPPLSPFQTLLRYDKDISYLVYRYYHANYPRFPLLLLEVSGHGLPWFLIPLLFYALPSTQSPDTSALLLNLLLISAVDLLAIAILKPLFHRQRPSYNNAIAAVTIHAVDQFSFPSGHATRAGLVLAWLVAIRLLHRDVLFPFLHASMFVAFVIVWAITVTASRVALGRHHLLDVIVGFLLGIFYVFIWSYFWVSPHTAAVFRQSIRGNLLGTAKLATVADLQSHI